MSIIPSAIEHRYGERIQELEKQLSLVSEPFHFQVDIDDSGGETWKAILTDDFDSEGVPFPRAIVGRGDSKATSIMRWVEIAHARLQP